ncbi:MAG: hypothetical protein H7Z42_03435 [Roseiflexaceae bacterium]|nr:hypothetical protein [Roseiflexaceae bacterium]
MPAPTLSMIEKDVRASGYQLLSSEQLRTNRWLLVARDTAGQRIAILVQLRALIGESDVRDLAELVQIRQFDAGILLIYGASLSAYAQRALVEVGFGRLRACASLPPAHSVDPSGVARFVSQAS